MALILKLLSNLSSYCLCKSIIVGILNTADSVLETAGFEWIVTL